MMDIKNKSQSLPQLIGLVAFIVALWCCWTGRTTIEAWNVPLIYGEDGLFGLANAKAYMDGDVGLFFQKSVSHLNAPFSANWNDWPITEELIYALIGWAGRFIGLFASGNLAVLLCHVLAGSAMWFVGHELRGQREGVFLCSIAYAFSPYAFARGFQHLSLTAYWHLPLICLVTIWLFSDDIRRDDRRWRISLFSALICGALNPYYTWIFLQFICMAFIGGAVNKDRRKTVQALIIGCVAVSAFVLCNFDTYSYALVHGPNKGAIIRGIDGLELYGLKLPELFFPSFHRWEWFQYFSMRHYYVPALIKGELGYSYLGALGVVGFLGLVVSGVRFIIKGDYAKIPAEWWPNLWVIFYSVVGGVNLVAGVLGMVLFRATNRYCVFILTFSLMFLIKFSSGCFGRRWCRAGVFCLVPIVLWDQLPNGAIPEIELPVIQQAVRRDLEFAQKLELALPRGAMIFQLPLVPFPENPPVFAMKDYEHFRPYIHTKNLRYSYGTTKGREAEYWQTNVVALPPAEMVDKLEKFGFSGVFINRKGFGDRGEAIISAMKLMGIPVAADSEDLIVFRLNPKSSPSLPATLGVGFLKGWSFPEIGHRWAIDSSAEFDVRNRTDGPQSVLIGFGIRALQSQDIKIFVNGVLLQSIEYRVGTDVQIRIPVDIDARAVASVRIASSVVPVQPGNGDPRFLAFDVFNFSVN